ncbi:MAG: tetratricopeptide repeat protein [Candidatus Margulisbacteria bacterium]|nr:tetratricopeptide repeat protein [Candidatus Margulisiibacteriota bacterium]
MNNKVLAKDTRYIILTVLLFLGCVGLWQSLLPWLAEYNYRAGFVANTYRKFPESIGYLDKAFKYAPWETYYLITQVKNYEEMSRIVDPLPEKVAWLNKAKSMYNYMLRINPTNPWYYNGLASIDLALFNLSQTVEERKKFFEEAGEAYKKAANIDTKNPLFQMSLAYYYHRSGKIDEAYKLYQKCVKLDDWFVEAYYNMAEIDLMRNNVESAIRNFEGMAAADRANYDAENKRYGEWVKGGNFNNYRAKLAEIYLSQKNFPKAIEFFKWAAEARPDDPKIWRGLGVSYHQAGQLEMAIYAYKQAITFDPELNDIYKYLGYLYYNVGLFNSSIENLRKYLSVNPGDEKARMDLGRIIAVSSRFKPN